MRRVRHVPSCNRTARNSTERYDLAVERGAARSLFLSDALISEWAGSSVGIATGYRLDGPGIEFR